MRRCAGIWARPFTRAGPWSVLPGVALAEAAAVVRRQDDPSRSGSRRHGPLATGISEVPLHSLRSRESGHLLRKGGHSSPTRALVE